MSFKTGLNLLLAAGLTITGGCGLNTGEPAPPTQTPSFSGDGYSCIGQIPEHLDSYFNDRMTESEIMTFTRCLQKSFVSFAQLTRGRDETSYSPDEIRRFLQRYFLKGRVISDALLNEFMIMKQVLIGGAADRITRPELYQAVEVLEDLGRAAVRLKPHLAVLNPRLAIQQDPAGLGERLNLANEALKQTIDIFAARLRKSPRVYLFSDLRLFLSEFRAFVKWDEHFTDAAPVDAWVAVFRSFKNATVTPEHPDGIGGADWAPLLQSMSRWYLSFLQYQVGIKGKPMLEGIGLQNTMFLAQEVFDLIEDALNRQPARQLSYAQLLDLARSLQGLGWVPKEIRACGLDTALHALLSRVFGDPRVPPSARGSVGLNLAALAAMRADFYRWAYTQLALDSRYHGQTSPRAVPKLQNLPVPLEVRTDLNGQRDPDWADFIQVKSLMRPLFSENGEGRVYLVPEAGLASNGLTNGFFNLSVMNILRSLVTLIFRGYSEDGPGAASAWQTGIKSAELQKFYEDFRDIGIDLKVIDKRNVTAGSRSFIEGNLFTYAADGLKAETDGLAAKLTFVESMQLFAFLYSGGSMAADLYHGLSVCPKGPRDINGKPKLQRACVTRALPALLMEKLTNMPGLLAFLRSAAPAERSRYAADLLAAAYSPANSDHTWVEANELSTLAVVLHYSEAVMTRYDANGDGVLTSDEVAAAEPIFSGFIQKFADERLGIGLSDREARGTFRYILYYKAMPGTSWSDYFAINYRSLFGPSLNVDRAQLVNVFQVIISQLFEVAPKPMTIQLPSAACQN